MVFKKGGRRRLTSVIVHGPPHMHTPALTHEHEHRYRVLIARQKYESTYALFISPYQIFYFRACQTDEVSLTAYVHESKKSQGF